MGIKMFSAPENQSRQDNQNKKRQNKRIFSVESLFQKNYQREEDYQQFRNMPLEFSQKEIIYQIIFFKNTLSGKPPRNVRKKFIQIIIV
jgi:hypothetical protein